MGWDNLNAGLYGLTPGVAPAAAARNDGTGVAQIAGPGAHRSDAAPIYSPQNPLFWFGGLILLAAGAIGFSSSGRIGPLKASVSAGGS